MLAVRETPATYSGGPRLLDRVRHAVRARHYSRRTEKAYVGWIKRYIFFHGKRHPAEHDLRWLDDVVRECLQLGVKDVDFSANQITIRSGKGARDRRGSLAIPACE
jgi:integrase